MRYRPQYTKHFLKQYKTLEKRGYDMTLLHDVVEKLSKGEVLPPKFKDHPLHGNKRGYRDCHIQDDWILIYKKDEGVLTLILAQTGTHSDVFE